MTAALELHNISKHFGSVQALRDVDFTLAQGEIHALLGENGAGKSTLMRVAFGLAHPDAGEVTVNGVRRVIRNPAVARTLGIGMVHQHFTSVPAFTVVDNIALGAGWSLSRGGLAERVKTLATETGLPIDPTARVGELPAALKQRVEVLKALAANARILLLDEPSSVLAPAESAALFSRLREFAARGISSVLITHKLEEALSVADRITVLRRGEVVHSGPAASVNARRLTELMIGDSEWTASSPDRTRRPGDVRIQAERLSVERPGWKTPILRDASLTVRAGELVGIAAVEGSGQRELMRAIGGLIRKSGGSLRVEGPVAFVPEDRTREALIGEFSLSENLALSQGRQATWVSGPWIKWPEVRVRTSELIAAYSIRAGGADTRVATLSGGNQQRLVIAAALERGPQTLIAENPTRGLDIKAAAEIHARLRAAARDGVAVLFHSSDLDEVIELSDRVVVVSQGRVTELTAGASRQEIGRSMLSDSTAA